MTSICLHSLTLTALETRKLIASLMLNITSDLAALSTLSQPDHLYLSQIRSLVLQSYYY